MMAVAAFGAGLVLVGVALGLLYMDVREHEAIRLAIEAQGGGKAAAEMGAIEKWKDPARVWSALWAGSIGAGLSGAGLLMAALELRVFKARDAGQGPGVG